MGEMKVNLCGIELDNPVIPASGTFGYGYEFAEFYDINILGTFSFKGTTKDPRFGNTNALVLFENPLDVLRVIEGGVNIKEVNVGSMAHSTGKVVVNKVLSMGREDVEAFEKMQAKGIHFDVRKVPNDSRDNMDDILKKAKAELAKA